jgi:hypothetical protein
VAENYQQRPIEDRRAQRRSYRRLTEPLPHDPAVVSALYLSAGALLVAFLFWVFG